LTVEVKENKDIIVKSGAVVGKFGNNAIPLGEVKLTYKSGNNTIDNVKFNKTVLVRIPVKAGVEKVFISAIHGS
jgi:hypothetical protein